MKKEKYVILEGENDIDCYYFPYAHCNKLRCDRDNLHNMVKRAKILKTYIPKTHSKLS
jgi:hypothetical protein